MALAYSTYDGYRTPGTVARRASLSSQSYPYSPYNTGAEDYSRYPYGEPRAATEARYTGGAYDDQGYYPSGYPAHATPRLNSYYGSGTYDDMALDREYTYGALSGGPGTMTPATRPRRSSSTSLHRQLSSGPGAVARTVAFDTSATVGAAVASSTSIIRFRTKGAFRSGVALTDAIAGVKLSGGDYIRWHQIKADARGRIYLRIRWNGYSALTYELPVDHYDGHVRLSSLARRIARAVIHFMQTNRIPISWDRVKLYYLEEVAYGTWQPALTVR